MARPGNAHHRAFRLRKQVNHYKKSGFSLWITSEISKSNNKLDPKCHTCDIRLHHDKIPILLGLDANNLNPLAMCREHFLQHASVPPIKCSL